MTRIFTVIYSTAALCAAAISLSAPAQAVPLTLTFDNPTQTVALPTTGFVTLDFNGTFTTTGNYHVMAAQLDYPFLLNSSTGLQPVFGAHVFDPAYNGVDQTFFTVQVNSTTTPGFYGYRFNSNSAPDFSLSAFSGQNSAFAQLPFTILVTNSLSAPEPSTYAAFGFGVLGLGILMLKARKRALTA